MNVVVLPAGDLQEFVQRAGENEELVVQPRMGMATCAQMAAGLRAVRRARAWSVGTVTLDSYTRVGDHDGARSAGVRGAAERLARRPRSPATAAMLDDTGQARCR
jgi:hypothetical protein